MLKKALGKAVLAFRSAGSQKYFTAQIKRRSRLYRLPHISESSGLGPIAIIYLALKIGTLGHENN